MPLGIFDFPYDEPELEHESEPPGDREPGVYFRTEDAGASYGFDIPLSHADEFVFERSEFDDGKLLARWNTDVDTGEMQKNGSRASEKVNAPPRMDGYATVQRFIIIDREP